MHNFLKSQLLRPSRRWPLLVLSGTLAIGATTGALRLRSLAHELLPGLLKAQLEAALGRSVEFGAIQVWPTGIWVDDLRIRRIAGEPQDPLTAKRLRVSADWWRLLSTRQLRIDGVDLDGAKLRLLSPAPRKPGESWAAPLLGLSRSGVGRFGLRNASIHVFAPSSKVALYTAEGVTGDVGLGADQLVYRAAAHRLRAQGTLLTGVRMAGAVDRDGLNLQSGSARYRDGSFEASGRVQARENAAQLTIRVKKLALSELAGELGIPADWAVRGDVTGEVTVDARDSSLRRVRGALNIARGSMVRDGSELPWEAAHAQVDWTPSRTRLKEIRIRGNGITVAGSADVTVPEGASFTAGNFEVSGQVAAERGEAVGRIGELLAFRKMLDGRWQAERASVRFTARGQVGDLQNASAWGRLRVEDLRFRPTAQSDTVLVSQLEGEVERTPARMRLRNVRAQTDGFTLAADASLTQGGPQGTPQVSAAGTVDVRDLKSLKKAVPEAALWKWIPVASPRASGAVRFALDGPLTDLEQLRSQGSFELKEFRLGAKSPLPNGAMFFIPVRAARGRFDYAGRRFEVRDLNLDTRTFQADGQIALSFDKAEPRVETRLHVSTEDWRGLPAMPVGAFPELQGGCLEADLHMAGDYEQISEAPVDGRFRLEGATYTPGRPNATPVPVRQLAARFLWEKGVLSLPLLAVDTPLVAGTSSGKIYPSAGEYRLALDVDARTEDAGTLLQRFTDQLRLESGIAMARVHVDAPVEHMEQAALSGTLELTEGRLLHAVEALGLKEIDAQQLSIDFTRHGERWDVSRLALDMPGVALSVQGSLNEQAIDARIHLVQDRWTAPAQVPVAGGRLALDGILRGAPTDPATLAFSGDVSVAGAQLRYADAGAAVRGGTLSLIARGEGVLTDPLRWLRSGELKLADAVAALEGRPEIRIEDLSGTFSAEAGRVRWKGARLAAGGIRASSSGEWSPKEHHVQVAAEVPDLERFGFALPEGFAARDYQLRLAVTGTPERPLGSVEGQVRADGVRIALAGIAPQQLERISGDFQLEGDRLELRKLEGNGPAGSVELSGEWSRKGHRLAVLASGPQFSRLGIALPEGFAAGAFRFEADLSGDEAHPFSRGTGNVQVRKVAFPFGPAGPHHFDIASSRFALAGGKVTLSDVLALGPAGQLTGTGEISPKSYSLKLASDGLDPKVAAWLVPGAMVGGKLTGTLDIAGNSETPVRVAGGKWVLTGSRYTLPPELELIGGPAAVARLAGTYRWEAGRTDITKIDLESDVVRGVGSLTVMPDGKGRVLADLATTDLGRVAGYWPVLQGLLRGGEGTGILETAFDPSGARGTIRLKGAGGTLVLPSAPAEYAEHPVETASLQLGFEPGRLTFQDVHIRGPKGNMDGEGEWSATGPVFGKGKAWFSKAYTARLVKPSGFGWLAKLIGVREIKSDWALNGTADRLNLKAGITKSFLWKFARGRVPKEFQDIASGKSPLWIRPIEVAETTAEEE